MRLCDKAMCVGLMSWLFGCGTASISDEPNVADANRLLGVDDQVDPCRMDNANSGRRVFMPQGEFYYNVPIGSSSQERKFAINIQREDKPNFYSDPSGAPTSGPPQISGYTRINRFEIFECVDLKCDSKTPYNVEGKNKGTLLLDASSDPVKVTQIFDPAPNSKSEVRRYTIENTRHWNSSEAVNGFPGRYFFDWKSLDPSVRDIGFYTWQNEEESPNCELNLIELSNCDRVGEPKWCPQQTQCRQVVVWRSPYSNMSSSAESCTAKCVNKQNRNLSCFQCESGYYAVQKSTGEYECQRVPSAGGNQAQNISTGQGTERTDFVSQFQCDVNALSSACEAIAVSTDSTCDVTSACGCECGGVSVSF